MDEKCYDLVSGAGLEPILMPRSQFILKGGRGRASGFIMRMMAENKLKHKGQYKNPTAPLAPESKMNKPVAFDLERLANPKQKPGGKNKSAYGASPFIMRHFGSPDAVEFVPRSDKGKAVASAPGETAAQKEARLRTQAEGLLEKAAELAEAEAPKATIAVRTEPEAPKALPAKMSAEGLKEYIDYFRKQVLGLGDGEDLSEFVPQKDGVAKGADCVWFGTTRKDGKKVVITPSIKIKPGINLQTVKEGERAVPQQTIIPASEATMKDGEKVLGIKSITTKNLRKSFPSSSGFQTWEIVDDDDDVPQIVLKVTPTKGEVEKFSYKSLHDMSIKNYIGFYAANLFIPPRTLYKEMDANSGTLFRPSKISEEEKTEYTYLLEQLLAQEGKYGDLTLTLNGVEYIQPLPEPNRMDAPGVREREAAITAAAEARRKEIYDRGVARFSAKASARQGNR